MKVKFLKNTTVDIMDAVSCTNDTYDKSFKYGDIVDIDFIEKVSNNFSNIRFNSGIWAVDVLNNSFQELHEDTKS